MNTVWNILTRRKVLDTVEIERTELRRVLNWLDLTALGVGSTLGVGVYVLAGHVAKDTAGPAVVLSFLIAAIASVFAGLCYAEFGARTPRAGSAYIYSYVCVGEFIAFIIGWNLILEYVIGSASVAKGLSLYLDTLINNTLQNTFIDIAPINVSFMSPYFDFFAFGISFILSVALAFGMKESSLVNNIFTLLNLGVVLFVIIAGSIKADPDNWHIPANHSSSAIGDGGFFPFGIEGMIKGAATCFYGFIGFDCIATTGEEVKNPQKAIPVSIILSLFIIFLSYFGTSTVVTLMVPYYLQDPNAPIPHAFDLINWEIAKWIVAIGGIFGLCASLFGAMFPLPRIIYAMASDNLVFRFLGKVNSRFQTPVIGTLLAGILTGLMAALFELKQLVDMMSIGTLLAYTIVAASVLLLRYEVNHDNIVINQPIEDSTESVDTDTYNEEDISENTELLTRNQTNSNITKQIFNFRRNQLPTTITQRIVTIEISIYCILCILIGLSAIYLKTDISNGEVWAIVLTSIVLCLMILIIMSIATQPQSRRQLSFKVPLVPLIPALSILINIYLMLMLDSHTWIRFGIWMLIGLPIYFFCVRTYKDAHNSSVTISSRNTLSTNKLNGINNNGFINDEKDDDKIVETTPPQSPPLPSQDKIESTIAVLDEILEEAAKSIITPINESNDIIVHTNDTNLNQTNNTTDIILNQNDINDDSETTPDEILNEQEILPIEWSTSVTEIVIPAIAIQLPRLSLSNLATVKLKTVPKTPPIDYSRETSTIDDDNSGDDHNLKLSTPEFYAFKEKLEKNLLIQMNSVPSLIPVVDKNVEIIEKPPPLPADGVIVESINTVDARKKLAAFLERSNDQNNNINDDDNKENIDTIDERSNINSSQDRDEHKSKMTDTLNSIKLKKVESFKNDIEDDKIETPTDEAQHRLKMTDTLNRIKLKKVESFKSDRDDTPNTSQEAKSVEKSKSDEKQHRLKMTDTLSRIKLRKVESFKSDRDDTPDTSEEAKSVEKSISDETQHRLKMTDTLSRIKLRKIDSFKD